MEDIDPDFVGRVQPGDIIVAAENFGCGSSREHAPMAIKAGGVTCVVAACLPASSTATPSTSACRSSNGRRPPRIAAGDTMKVNLAAGVVANVTQGTSHRAAAFPGFMREIAQGGLLPFVKARLEVEGAA